MMFSYLDPESIALIGLGLIVLSAAIIDLRSQRIPNKITFPALLVGLAFHSFLNGFDGLMFGIKGMCLGMAIFIIPYILGKMGAGDAKLMGAIGAFIGFEGVIVSFVYIALTGGIYVLILTILYRQQFKGFFQEQYVNAVAFYITKSFAGGYTIKDSNRPRLCYGVAIAVGTWLYIGFNLLGVNQLLTL